MLYEKMNYGENLGWCKPYVSDDESCCVAVNGGKIVGCTINGEVIDVCWNESDSDLANRLAIAVNADYAYYKGWGNLHIALDAMHEVGCSECPYRDDCDAMWEDD